MAAGYPFDVPAPGSSLLTYCVLAYHLPLLVAFSTRQRIQFVWGGCMVLPLGPLRDDRYGIVKVSVSVPSTDTAQRPICAAGQVKLITMHQQALCVNNNEDAPSGLWCLRLRWV